MSSIIQANVTIQGSLTTVGTLGQSSYAPVDLGVNSLSLATGNLTSLITTSSSSPFAASLAEGSLVFPGTSNAYISFGTSGVPFSNSNIYAFGDFVVEAWVNPTSLANAPVLIGQGNATNSLSWVFSTNILGRLQWLSTLNGALSSCSTSTALSTGTWTHIAAIHQSSTKRIQIYINGQPQTFASTGGNFSSSGTILSYTNGIIPITTYETIIGQLADPTYTLNGSLTNLRIVTGSGAAQIYNNNAFTPSTSPLFPASNTAGGSLTTRLLVRVPATQGKFQVQKLIGAGSTTGVQAFPPAPLTGYATNLTGLSPYGQGTYVASASNEFDSSTNALWHTFDKSTSSIWTGDGSSYSSGNYIKSPAVTTVDINGTAYQGEWVQLQMPSSVVLSSYQVAANGTTGPRQFYLFGSRDGVSWTLVDRRSAQTTWTSGVYVSYSVSSSQAFTYFRFVTNQTNGSSSYVQIQEIIYNGTIEGANFTSDGRVGLGVVNPTRALEVAGDVVCAGTLSAGNPLMFRNALYNGAMAINQRGISTNWASPTAIGASTTTYAVDRWNPYRGSATTGAVMAQGTLATTDAPYFDGLQYYLRLGRASGDTNTIYTTADYNLESRDSYRFAGQPVTLSFYYRTGSGFSGSILQAFVYSSTGIDQGGRTGLTNRTTISNLSLALSNAWQRTTVTGFAPLNCSQLVVSLSYTAFGTAGGFDYFDVTGVQLEKGSVATPFEVRPYATELALCQRYYEQSYEIGTAPGTNTNTGVVIVSGSSDSVNRIYYTLRYAVPKRTNIASTFYTNSGTSSLWSWARNGASGTVLPSAYNSSTSTSYTFYIDIGATFTTGLMYGHWVANAEL